MKKALVILCMSLATACAQAATVSFNSSFAQAPTEINQTVSLSLFNPALGTLTGASLRLTGDATFMFTATNNGAQPVTFQPTFNTQLLFSSSLVALNTIVSGSSMLLTATPGSQGLGPAQSVSFSGSSGLTSSGTVTDNLSAILASLQGVGSFTITGTSLTGTSLVGGGGNISISQNNLAGIGSEIVYTYTPGVVTPPPSTVPEPGSLALASLAMMGALFASRRKKA